MKKGKLVFGRRKDLGLGKAFKAKTKKVFRMSDNDRLQIKRVNEKRKQAVLNIEKSAKGIDFNRFLGVEPKKIKKVRNPTLKSLKKKGFQVVLIKKG